MVIGITARRAASSQPESATPLDLRILNRILAAAAMPFRAWRARRDMAQLAGMSEHELRDIGLTRQDLMDATATRMGEDPTSFLSQRASERRLRRHSLPR